MSTEQADLYLIAEQERLEAERREAGSDSSSDCNGDCEGCGCEPPVYKPDTLAKKILMAPVYLFGAIVLILVCVIEFFIEHTILAIIIALFVARILSSWIF